jgi:hypothetical protein
MRKLLFLLMFTFCFSPEIFVDFFKWEIQLAVKGFGKEIETFPVATEGKIQFSDIKIECRMESFWTRIEADLLLEGKTLVCVNGEKEKTVSVICRDNHRNRKYNKLKERYPATRDGFRLKPESGMNSPYLELRCFF